ncbi:hypothetical protein D037_0348, partial [Vibrio parahaemolyticus IDH02640]
SFHQQKLPVACSSFHSVRRSLTMQCSAHQR